jgi:hypothetical protein
MADNALDEKFEDKVVQAFILQLARVQTHYKMIRGSTVTAVTYRWCKSTSEKKGTVSVAVREEEPSFLLQFAFATFVNRSGKEAYTKKGLRETASKRLDKEPHLLEIHCQEMSRFERHVAIRREIQNIRKKRGLQCLQHPKTRHPIVYL